MVQLYFHVCMGVCLCVCVNICIFVCFVCRSEEIKESVFFRQTNWDDVLAKKVCRNNKNLFTKFPI